jgi:preprotein translocase subunit YajC
MMMVLLFAVMYFLMIRPQKQKEKERLATLQKIKSGDRVLFSGIIGTVTNVKDKTLVIRVADKVKVDVLRGAVTQILEKDELPSDADLDPSK